MLMPVNGDPQLFGGHVALKLAKWILDAATVESAWSFDAEHGASVGGAGGVVVASGGGVARLKRDGQPDVSFKYALDGESHAVCPPAELLTLTQAPPRFPKVGQLRLLRSERDFADANDFALPNRSLNGPCMVVELDGKLVGGAGVGAMLLGVDLRVEGIMRELERRTRELMTIIKRARPNGYWSRSWDTFAPAVREDVAQNSVSYSVTEALGRLQARDGFRAALFFREAEGSAAATTATASAAIAVRFGVVRA
jgi:hypothetical protein